METPPQTPGLPEPRPSRLLRAVFGSTFFVRFGFGLSASIFVSYLAGRSVGISAETYGIVGAVTALAPIGEFTTVLFSGAASDRVGRFPVLLVGIAGSAILLGAISLSRELGLLAAINFLFGVSSGAILAPSLAVVGDQADPGKRGYEMGWFDSMNLLGYIVGLATGLGALGALANADLVWVFRAGALLLFIGFLFAYFSARGHREGFTRDTFSRAHLQEAVGRRDVLLVALPWLVIYVLIGAALAFLATASKSVGISTTLLALLIGGGGLLLLLTQPSFGRLADRYGRLRLMVIGTAGFVFVMVFGALIATYGALLPLLVGISASVLAALSYGPAALAALADVSRSVSRGTTMAVYSLAISLGMILGLFGSTALYARYGTQGVDLFFAVIALPLVVLTAVRWNDLRTGKGLPVSEPAPIPQGVPGLVTTPAQPTGAGPGGTPPGG